VVLAVQMKVERPITLVVEDDDADFQLLQAAVRRTPGDVQIHRVDDGEAAVAYLAGENDFSDRSRFPLPHLVLMDIKLPRRSGLEVLQWLRQQPGICRMPVIMFTSSRHSVDVNRAYDYGASAYFSKPETMKELTEMLGALKHVWSRWIEFPSLEKRPN
jgi:CheY-like chemotaxis protein